LGGPASHISVGKVAHGLMLMTWTAKPVPDEQCFEAMQASIESVPAGSKMVINSGEFYGIEPRTANLELVSRFFTKYPDLADRAFLSVKVRASLVYLVSNMSHALVMEYLGWFRSG